MASDDAGIVVAVYNDTQEYPLGLKKWNIFNDNCPGNGERWLTFSSCSKDEFTCNDGACVALKLKCDQIKHCPDNSDEVKCDKVLVDTKSYNRNIPPKIRTKKRSDKRIRVTIGIEEFLLLDINDVKQTFDVRFWLKMDWYDSRVTFLNLIPFQETILSLQDMEKLWIPKLILERTNEHTRTSFSDATIKAKADYPQVYEDPTQLKEAVHYQGFNTPIKSKALYHQRFSCHFDVTMFPFDSHCCNVVLRLVNQQQDFVHLWPEKLNIPIDSKYNSERGK